MMDAVSIRVPYKNLKQEVELVGTDEWEHRQIRDSSSPPGSSGAGDSPQDSDQHVSPPVNCSLMTLILSCTVAAGVQFGWALQLSLLTPYVQVIALVIGYVLQLIYFFENVLVIRCLTRCMILFTIC